MPEMVAWQIQAPRSSLVKADMSAGSSLKPKVLTRTRVVEETQREDHSPENLLSSIFLAVSFNVIQCY